MILNIHGFKGNPINTNYKQLCEYHPANGIISPEIDYYQGPEDICDMLKRKFDEFHIHYIVGQSFGGFWALYLSSYLRVPCILTNPCVYPSRYIPGIDADWKFGPNYGPYQYTLRQQIKCLPAKSAIILGTKDDILNPKDVTSLPFTQCMIQRIDAGHNIELTSEFCKAFKRGVEFVENRTI